MGIQTSAKATTRSRTFGPLPPSRMGGRGSCSGFGHCQIGSNETCLPWYSASSFAQIVSMASTRSRISEKRVRGSVPWLRISSSFQPAPTPNMKRPPLIRSTVAAAFAVRIGSRSTTRQMPVASSSSVVAAAAAVRATNGS